MISLNINIYLMIKLLMISLNINIYLMIILLINNNDKLTNITSI
jgi:hypothetical protein